MSLQQQMSLFQEGGLEQDGGTVDPVSGNDVPIGSSQEEVRDDIPAQLSEGEFVFPADVVRFIGLSKLMNLRQQAKAGLKRMEAMGQMGNSEEAILPDDIPFNMDDLDLEDDSIPAYQGGSIQSFANGGSPYASDINVQGGQTFQQQDFSIPPITTQPVQPMPIDDYVSPIQDNTPVDAPTDPLPPFDVFIPPVADEYREYIETDSALERRFQPTIIEEPDPSHTETILRGIKEKFEVYHNVKYSVKVIKSIVSLADRYITDRNFPDKAIDIMDEIGAKIRATIFKECIFDDDVHGKIDELERKKISARKSKDMKLADQYKTEQNQLYNK